MGSLLQLLLSRVGGKILSIIAGKMMYKVCAALLLAGAALSSPVPDAKAEAEPGYGGYSSGPHCQQKVDRQCHKKPIQKQRQECHEEYDVVIDTTYIEKCEDIVTQHCQEVHTKVSKSSHVVGHDSKVVDVKSYGGYEAYGYGHHGKREAEADAEAGHHGYSSGPQCQQHVEKQCHKVPQQNSRKVPRPVCKTVVDTTYVEECQDIVTQHCQESHQQVHHSSAVVGHDSQVIHGGHYGKREAAPEAGVQGYSSGPKCHQNVEKKCHQKPIQKERQECHEEYDVVIDTTYTEKCEEIVTRHCQEVHTQVHKSSHVVGHDSKVIGHYGGYSQGGHGKREAGHGGYGQVHSSGPKCHENVEKQCHKIPQHNAKKIPRPVCKTVVDTTHIEECEDIVTEHCEEVSKQVHHSSAVVGHDSQVIHGGHGHGK